LFFSSNSFYLFKRSSFAASDSNILLLPSVSSTFGASYLTSSAGFGIQGTILSIVYSSTAFKDSSAAS